MIKSVLAARRLPPVSVPEPTVDPDVLRAYLEDASGTPAGRAAGLVRVHDEAEAAAFMRAAHARGDRLLFQAARSSLTGGAVPRGEVVVSVEGLRELGPLSRSKGRGRFTVASGVRIDELETTLAERGFYYPPVPTHRQAMLGGTVSTNAGGAATFKYGATRRWVHGLRVLLANGDLLELERGQALASPGEAFRIRLSDGVEIAVPAPRYRLPPLKKLSAGYFSGDPLDLVDLFVGAEGTLGLITAVTVDLVPLPAEVVTGLTFLDSPGAALELARDLRRSADVRAIEWLDAASLDLLRQDERGPGPRPPVPERARAAVLFELELDGPPPEGAVEDAVAAFVEGRAGTQPRGPWTRLLGALQHHGGLDGLELALARDSRRQRAVAAIRERVPQRVGELLTRRRRGRPGVRKVGGDLIVPVEHLPAMLDGCREAFERRGLGYAIWGHLGDGNLHPNALPRDADEADRGCDALLELADVAMRYGGSPLSEHGVGRSPIKQQLLRRFLGDDAIDQMRRIKLALDPDGRLAPGVLFAPRLRVS